jgi:hypothetical protein
MPGGDDGDDVESDDVESDDSASQIDATVQIDPTALSVSVSGENENDSH